MGCHELIIDSSVAARNHLDTPGKAHSVLDRIRRVGQVRCALLKYPLRAALGRVWHQTDCPGSWQAHTSTKRETTSDDTPSNHGATNAQIWHRPSPELGRISLSPAWEQTPSRRGSTDPPFRVLLPSLPPWHQSVGFEHEPEPLAALRHRVSAVPSHWTRARHQPCTEWARSSRPPSGSPLACCGKSSARPRRPAAYRRPR